MIRETLATIALLAPVLAVAGFGAWVLLARAVRDGRSERASESMRLLMKESGHLDDCPGYANGARVLVWDSPKRPLIEVWRGRARHSPAEPGPTLREAMRAIGRAHRVGLARFYDFRVADVPDSATARAAARMTAAPRILALGEALGEEAKPALALLAERTARRHGGQGKAEA